MGGQEGPKGSSKGGSENGSEKVIENGSQNEAFLETKTSKSVVRYCKIKVLRGSEKYQKMMEKGSQNGAQKFQKWSPWRPWGGQGATLSPRSSHFGSNTPRWAVRAVAPQHDGIPLILVLLLLGGCVLASRLPGAQQTARTVAAGAATEYLRKAH